MKLSLLLSASLLAVFAATSLAKANSVTFTYTGGFQSYTAPTTGLYDILAYGGQGGANSNGASGGLGARIGGDIMLSANEMLRIAVGGAGSMGVTSGGGGGGSFVIGPSITPLVIGGGGGGGGTSFYSPSNGYGGLAGPTGGSGAGGTAGGTGGQGGAGGYYVYGGGGGGGLRGRGGNGTGGGFGGNGYPNFAGGRYGVGYSVTGGPAGGPGSGGFGGGGGGSYGNGGGGGGYNGGGGGGFGGGGGGGSFLSASAINDVLLSGVNPGNGLVTISEISTSPPIIPTPEPGSLALLSTGLIGLGLTLRYRNKT